MDWILELKISKIWGKRYCEFLISQVTNSQSSEWRFRGVLGDDQIKAVGKKGDKGLHSFRPAGTAEGSELEKMVTVVGTSGPVEPGEVLVSLVATSQGWDVLHLWAGHRAIALRVWSGWSSASQIFTALTMSLFMASLGRPEAREHPLPWWKRGYFTPAVLSLPGGSCLSLSPHPSVHLHINRATFKHFKGLLDPDRTAALTEGLGLSDSTS